MTNANHKDISVTVKEKGGGGTIQLHCGLSDTQRKWRIATQSGVSGGGKYRGDSLRK
jgi:hypothetical protein